ncbi:alpha/beta fold hydrolase [Nocardia sp. NBC_01388]|uniref:alpha/beta fold hydrolase n=1 Tax=Nocardia sp. NBC_01388 TaxID=2903596 RepID=UPI00324B45CD
MVERIARCNGIDIAYETFGDPAHPTVLLIMGFGSQMITWPVEFCELIAARGYQVVRYDNRDTGHSSRITGGPTPNPLATILFGGRKSASYTLEDMAGDALGLLDHLGVDKAHIVGGSMGGAIAQSIAIDHPDRLLSLVSVMSPTGRLFWKEIPDLALLLRLLTVDDKTRKSYVEQGVAVWRAQGSPGEPFDEAWTRGMLEESWERGVDSEGTARQLVAILSSTDRRPLLRRITAPTLVLHGTDDKLVRPRAGRYAANAIPGARLVEIAGWGHDLPPTLHRRLADELADHADRVHQDH